MKKLILLSLFGLLLVQVACSGYINDYKLFNQREKLMTERNRLVKENNDIKVEIIGHKGMTPELAKAIGADTVDEKELSAIYEKNKKQIMLLDEKIKEIDEKRK